MNSSMSSPVYSTCIKGVSIASAGTLVHGRLVSSAIVRYRPVPSGAWCRFREARLGLSNENPCLRTNQTSNDAFLFAHSCSLVSSQRFPSRDCQATAASDRTVTRRFDDESSFGGSERSSCVVLWTFPWGPTRCSRGSRAAQNAPTDRRFPGDGTHIRGRPHTPVGVGLRLHCGRAAEVEPREAVGLRQETLPKMQQSGTPVRSDQREATRGNALRQDLRHAPIVRLVGISISDMPVNLRNCCPRPQ